MCWKTLCWEWFGEGQTRYIASSLVSFWPCRVTAVGHEKKRRPSKKSVDGIARLRYDGDRRRVETYFDLV